MNFKLMNPVRGLAVATTLLASLALAAPAAADRELERSDDPEAVERYTDDGRSLGTFEWDFDSLDWDNDLYEDDSLNEQYGYEYDGDAYEASYGDDDYGYADDGYDSDTYDYGYDYETNDGWFDGW